MSSGAAPTADHRRYQPHPDRSGCETRLRHPGLYPGYDAVDRPFSTDLAVQGSGFFIYDNGQELRYSREGSLELDADGYLVNNSTGTAHSGLDGSGQRHRLWIPTSPSATCTSPSTLRWRAKPPTINLAGNLDSSSRGRRNYIDTTYGVYDSLGSLHNVTIRFHPHRYERMGLGHARPRSAGHHRRQARLTFDDQGPLSSQHASTTTIHVPRQHWALRIST